jgi:hypothetical protein
MMIFFNIPKINVILLNVLCSHKIGNQLAGRVQIEIESLQSTLVLVGAGEVVFFEEFFVATKEIDNIF